MVAAICSVYPPETVLIAAVTTLFATIGLTIAAFRMSEEMIGYCNGLAFAMSLAALPVIIFSFFYMNRIIYIVIQLFFVFLYSVYILVDTRNICQKFSKDDYIIAAVILYMDIIMLFLKLLELFGALSGNNWKFKKLMKLVLKDNINH